MKFYIPHCRICIENNMPGSGINLQDHRNDFFEIEDDFTVLKTCTNKHKTVYYLYQFKFEMLFNFGFSAIFDGNRRAAFINFVGSLEEFYRFCIKVFLHTNEKPIGKVFFKKNLKYSEQQYGAFLVLNYKFFKITREEEKASLRNKQEMDSLRNNVVHSGDIPSNEDLIKYGEYVYDIIFEVLENMRNDFRENLLACHSEIETGFKKAEEKAIKLADDGRMQTCSVPSILRLASLFIDKDFFEQVRPFKDILSENRASPDFANTALNYRLIKT